MSSLCTNTSRLAFVVFGAILALGALGKEAAGQCSSTQEQDETAFLQTLHLIKHGSERSAPYPLHIAIGGPEREQLQHLGAADGGHEGPQNMRNWMGRVDPDVRLGSLTIPGTHDTAAWEFNMNKRESPGALRRDATGMTLTQRETLTDQLEHGIRWIDMRIGLAEASVVTCHGPFHMSCDFRCMIEMAAAFLVENPSEVVFIMLKPECGETGDALTQGVKDELLSHLPAQVLGGGVVTPQSTLAAVRGKIVIVDTLTWDHLPGLHDLQNRIRVLPLFGVLTGPDRNVQNDYKLGYKAGITREDERGPELTQSREGKIAAVRDFLKKAAHELFHDAIWINYFSASGWDGWDVMKTAREVNVAVLEMLKEPINSPRGVGGLPGAPFGACLLDGLPDAAALELIRMLVERNFQRPFMQVVSPPHQQIHYITSDPMIRGYQEQLGGQAPKLVPGDVCAMHTPGLLRKPESCYGVLASDWENGIVKCDNYYYKSEPSGRMKQCSQKGAGKVPACGHSLFFGNACPDGSVGHESGDSHSIRPSSVFEHGIMGIA